MKRVILVVMLVSLYGCGATSPVKQIASSGSEFTITAAPVIASPGVIYATVKKNGDKWQLIEVSPRRMSVPADAGVERLYVDMWRKIISPDYVEFKYRESIKDEDLFECKRAYRDIKKGSYIACYSALAKNSGFGDGWFGYLKAFDGDEVVKVASDVSLIDKAMAVYSAENKKANNCRAIYARAQELANNHDISPVIFDKTGIADTSKIKFYTRKDLERVSDYDKCPTDVSDVVVHYQVEMPAKIGIFNLGLSSVWKKTDNLVVASIKIGEIGSLPRPKVTYTEFYWNTYYVDGEYSDSVMYANWDGFVLDDDISFVYLAGNMTKKHVRIKSITFYIGPNAFKFYVGRTIPPESEYSRSDLVSMPISRLTSEQKTAVNKLRTVSKRGAPLELGVSVSYEIDGKNETLYGVRTRKIGSYRYD